MANIAYKTLGQQIPTAGTMTTLYTTPTSANANTIVSTMAICNRFTQTQYQVAVVPNGQTLSSNNYVIFNNILNPNDTVFLTLGITLGQGDQVQVLSYSGNVAFSMFGTELS
jgi:hypothetical protein